MLTLIYPTYKRRARWVGNGGPGAWGAPQRKRSEPWAFDHRQRHIASPPTQPREYLCDVAQEVPDASQKRLLAMLLFFTP